VFLNRSLNERFRDKWKGGDMKTHIQEKDLYTKIVLTVIALALCLIALNPWIAPTTAFGKSPVPVRIVSSTPYSLQYSGPIHVKVDNWP